MRVTLCGSYAFQKKIEEVASTLKASGHEVKYPELEVSVAMPDGSKMTSIAEYIKINGGIDALASDDRAWVEKGKAIDDHFAKIAWADAILVVNGEKKGISGYVGGNTLMETGLARYLKKKIFLMERPSSQLSYAEEIFGCQPTIIDGDLTKIV